MTHAAHLSLWRMSLRKALAPGILGALGFLATSSCLDRPESVIAPEITPALMASLVTGAAAANLDAAGHFQLQGPPETGPRQITRKQAEALASSWPHQFGTWARPVLEREHGRPITVSALAVCGRTLYAESPFEPFDAAITADPMGAVAQRAYGPWWLVTLCGASSTPQVSLGVSAYATDLTIKDGQILGPVLGGEWFSPEGIPVGASEEFILSPERAAERVATNAKRRIREVPRLVIPLRREGFPNHPYWSLALDASAAVQPDNGRPRRQEERLYIGRRPTGRSNTLAVAASVQPEEVTISYPTNIKVGTPERPRQYGTIRARRRVDLPIAFEPVTIAQSR